MATVIAENLILTGNDKEPFWGNSVLVPVPLDRKKLKQRGYNQSEELAKELSKITNIPVLSDVLIKTKTTASQMKLNKEERQSNIQGAFTVQNPSEIEGKKVFLIDDVYTTGSTMEECANVLRTYRTNRVFGLVIAREE